MIVRNYCCGLKVVMDHMPDRYSTAVGLYVDVGGRYEKKSEIGLSHFLEHMVFKGTKKRTCQKIKESIEGIGGMINAYTSKEHTCFYAKVLSKDTLHAIDVLTDMIVSPLFQEKDIEQEKSVVIEEINMYLDSPLKKIEEYLDELLWNDHPLGNSLTGSEKDVRSFTQEHCFEFVQKYYQPVNIVLSIAGNIEEEKLSQDLKTLFLEDSSQIHSTFEPYQIKKRDFPVRWFPQDVEQTHIALAFYSYPRTSQHYYSLNILSIILGGNMSSRLFNELREKKGWAYDISSSCSFYKDVGSFEIFAGLDSKNLIGLTQVLQTELQKIKDTWVSQEELTRAKTYCQGHLFMAFEQITSRMSRNAESLMIKNEIQSLDESIQKIQEVSPEDIQTIAQDIFKKEKLVLVGISSKDRSDEVKSSFQNFN